VRDAWFRIRPAVKEQLRIELWWEDGEEGRRNDRRDGISEVDSVELAGLAGGVEVEVRM
jgi:hypothetical protein